ncbi:MAG: hypothetical protein ABI895_38465 [Deltaproteobacteria bacterium]
MQRFWVGIKESVGLCDQCAALYHRQHLPAECKSCGRPLTAAAARVAATG